MVVVAAWVICTKNSRQLSAVSNVNGPARESGAVFVAGPLVVSCWLLAKSKDPSLVVSAARGPCARSLWKFGSEAKLGENRLMRDAFATGKRSLRCLDLACFFLADRLVVGGDGQGFEWIKHDLQETNHGGDLAPERCGRSARARAVSRRWNRVPWSELEKSAAVRYKICCARMEDNSRQNHIPSAPGKIAGPGVLLPGPHARS
jgi:hypothetical protein